jgi:hypothetical protein
MEAMDETVRQTVFVRNPSSEPTKFVLEPWGEVYEMPGDAEFEVVAEGPPGGSLEVHFGASEITVYSWVGAVAWLYHDGVELGARPDGSNRSPPPVTPKGTKMSDFVDRLFGKQGKGGLS